MRATQSHTTRLDGRRGAGGAHRPVELPVGPSADALVVRRSSLVFETLVAAVYRGIARRAVSSPSRRRRPDLAPGRGSAARRRPVVRWRVADAAWRSTASSHRSTPLARDVDALVDHGADWPRLVVGLKTRVTETARAVVDQAVTVAGGASYRTSSELGRLQRDVLAGRFHPSSTDSAHATIAARLLGPAGRA